VIKPSALPLSQTSKQFRDEFKIVCSELKFNGKKPGQLISCALPVYWETLVAAWTICK